MNLPMLKRFTELFMLTAESESLNSTVRRLEDDEMHRELLAVIPEKAKLNQRIALRSETYFSSSFLVRSNLEGEIETRKIADQNSKFHDLNNE